MSFNLDAQLQALCANVYLQGLAVGLIWTPIVTTAFRTLSAGLRPEGVALLHLIRSIGSSFFISIAVTEIVRTTAANYSRMTEFVTPYNKALALPSVMGEWTTESLVGLAAISREINRQAAMLGYLNAFGMYTVVSLAAIPLVLMLGRRRQA
jgi:DHA2 family multidrug resistance protein